MKKLYTSALAALCVFGVSAGINGAQLRSDFNGERNQLVAKTTQTGIKQAALEMKKVAGDKVMSRAAGDLQSIAGDYTAYLGDYYYKDGVGSIEVSASITLEGENLTISSEWFPTDVTAKYDEETGTISFKAVKLGKMTLMNDENEEIEYYVRFEPFEYTGNGTVMAEYDATYYAEFGQIEFPADHGFSWVAYSDSKYGLMVGSLDKFDVEGMELSSNWLDLGLGKFTDNAFAPAFGVSVSPYEVAVYQSAVNTAIYKVINPWKGFYEANKFQSLSPTIYLDATDPDNVLLDLTSTGVNGGETDGLYGILNDGWYCEETGAGQPDAFTTLTKDGDTTTFTFEPGSLLLYASATNKIYTLGKTASTIVIKSDVTGGIDDIEADENAPVEYFNLQGVRVDNPAAGQFVIKRQGSNVTKTIVR